MPVANSYDITLKVDKYLKDGGSKTPLLNALNIKEKKFDQLFKDQKWEKRHVKKLMDSGLLAVKPRRQPRAKVRNAEEISQQVKSWMEELGSISKFCKTLGIKQEQTYKSRLVLHNWTQQEVAILISKRIIDDSLAY